MFESQSFKCEKDSPLNILRVLPNLYMNAFQKEKIAISNKTSFEYLFVTH